MEAADIVIVFLSTTSVSKEGYIQKELRYALDIALEKPEGTIFIIPVRLDDCVIPRKIKDLQYIDFLSAEKNNDADEKLLDSLKYRANQKGISIFQKSLVQSKVSPVTDNSINSNHIDFGSTDVRRMPMYLLIECGDSMRGAPIMAVEQGVQVLCSELMGQPQAMEMVHLSVITYTTYAQQIVPLTPLPDFTPPSLIAGGTQNLGNALRVLGDCVDREIIRNTSTTKGDYKALVFWITDSVPTDNWYVGLKYLRERTDGLLGSIIALGAGDGVDYSLLKQVTPYVLSMKDVTPDTLKTSFRWQSQPTH